MAFPAINLNRVYQVLVYYKILQQLCTSTGYTKDSSTINTSTYTEVRGVFYRLTRGVMNWYILLNGTWYRVYMGEGGGGGGRER